MLGFFTQFKTYLIIFAVVALALFGFYEYFKYSQNKIAALNQTIAKQQVALDIETATVNKLKDNALNTQLASDDLNKKFNQIEKDTSTLTKEFSDHDLGILAQKKPGIIEKIVNDATKKTLKQFEDMSQVGGF